MQVPEVHVSASEDEQAVQVIPLPPQAETVGGAKQLVPLQQPFVQLTPSHRHAPDTQR